MMALRYSLLTGAFLWMGLFSVGGAPASAGGGLTPELAQAMSRPPERFGSLLCSQIRYLEAKVLAAGRVCPQSSRAQRSFAQAPRCLSGDEGILPGVAKAYLEQLRAVADAKACDPWR